MRNLILFSFIILLSMTNIFGQKIYETDEFNTSKGKLKITFIGHATLMFEYNGKVIHIDPCGQYADYSTLPKADIILITHQHPDHFDTKAIDNISKDSTILVITQTVRAELKNGTVIDNGEKTTIDDILIEAVPAYNTTEGRDKFHPKGRDNGYILTIANKRIYIAGDTEDIPEMSSIKKIDIAFLPMNQPYTMLPKQAAKVALQIKPKILYPYHFGDTKVDELVKLLAKNKKIEVRVRKLN